MIYNYPKFGAPVYVEAYINLLLFWPLSMIVENLEKLSMTAEIIFGKFCVNAKG